MSMVAKALWYIENNYARPGLTLDEVAAACAASRFHLTRAFGLATGHSLMRYLRARRLTEAARALAAGAPDILAVALDAGYGSHEAFTRAFRDQFGMTPEAVRAQGDCSGLALVPALRLDHRAQAPMVGPRLVDRPAFKVAGLSARYTPETVAGVPRCGSGLAPMARRPGASALMNTGSASTSMAAASTTPAVSRSKAPRRRASRCWRSRPSATRSFSTPGISRLSA